jgi:hypothetical protein
MCGAKGRKAAGENRGGAGFDDATRILGVTTKY